METSAASQLVALIFIHFHRRCSWPRCLNKGRLKTVVSLFSVTAAHFPVFVFFKLILCPLKVVILRHPALCYDVLFRCVALKAYESETCLAWLNIYLCVFTTIQVFCTLILPVTCKINPIYCEPIYFVWFALDLMKDVSQWINLVKRMEADGSAAVFSCVKCFIWRWALPFGGSGPMELTSPVLTVIMPSWSTSSRPGGAYRNCSVKLSCYCVKCWICCQGTVDIFSAVLLTLSSTATLSCVSLLQHWNKIRHKTK